ncbi:MAG TPA: hypothetical protein VGJ69_01895 [Pyrinomonadaceae bacterium]
MKKVFRNAAFLTLLAASILATPLTISSSPPPQDFPDPACVSTCTQLLYECIASGQKNNDHACISVYRHCIAQCGKH